MGGAREDEWQSTRISKRTRIGEQDTLQLDANKNDGTNPELNAEAMAGKPEKNYETNSVPDPKRTRPKKLQNETPWARTLASTKGVATLS